MMSKQILCVLCGNDETKIYLNPPNSPGPLVKCSKCGLVYVNPIVDDRSIITNGPVINSKNDNILKSKNLEDIRGSWELNDILKKTREINAIKLNSTNTLNRIQKFVKTGTVLDFGCGAGLFLGIAKKNGWKTFGIEPLPAHAVYARAMFDADVICDTLRHEMFPKQYFDVITSFQVFEHLPNPLDDLSQLVEYLKPNGLMVIEVPNIDNWTVKIMREKHRHFVQDHLYFFSAMTLTTLMEKCGLSVVKITYPVRYMTVAHLLGWIERYSRHISKLTKGQHWMNEVMLPVKMGDIIEVIATKV